MIINVKDEETYIFAEHINSVKIQMLYGGFTEAFVSVEVANKTINLYYGSYESCRRYAERLIKQLKRKRTRQNSKIVSDAIFLD